MSPRKRPDIQAANEYIQRVEYLMCHGESCRNVIAAWLKTPFCSRCRGRKAKLR